MRDVRIGHDQIMIANSRASSTLHRPAIDRDKLANLVVGANLQPRRLARISNVLRSRTYRSEGGKAITSANFRRSINHHMRSQTAIRTQLNLRPNHAIRPNLA